MNEVKQDVLDSFQTMWGLFPEPVLLLHASRKILARNKVAEALGIPAGVPCHSLHGREKACAGCLADKALKRGEALRHTSWSPLARKFMDTFWCPVEGEKDIYVHFGNDITEFVKAELLPAE